MTCAHQTAITTHGLHIYLPQESGTSYIGNLPAQIIHNLTHPESWYAGYGQRCQGPSSVPGEAALRRCNEQDVIEAARGAACNSCIICSPRHRQQHDSYKQTWQATCQCVRVAGVSRTRSYAQQPPPAYAAVRVSLTVGEKPLQVMAKLSTRTSHRHSRHPRAVHLEQ